LRRAKRGVSILDMVLYTILVLGFIAALGVSLFVLDAVRTLPTLSSLEPKPTQASYVFDANGNLWSELRSSEYRIPIELKDVPDYVKNAVIAQEDHRFYTHKGFDLKAILRALYVNLRSQSIQEGGSTISQQLAKTAFLEPARTLKRKIQDVILAVRLERSFTKDEILGMYLNQVFFGRNAYGIEAAARMYFGKSASQLSLGEAAFLAGILRSPSAYDPGQHPDECITVRNNVLDKMVTYGFISKEEADRAKAEPFRAIPYEGGMVVPEGAYFFDYVLKELLSRYPKEQVYGGGLRVYTTYVPSAQKAAEEAIASVLDPVFPIQAGKDHVEAAAIIMDPKTGHILAMVGGREHQGMLSWNRAVDTTRQPGSAIKPIAVYVPALEMGMSPATVVDDSPYTWKDPYTGEEFSPQNYGGTFRGLITIRDAIRESVNVVAFKVFEQVTPKVGVETCERFGITTLDKNASDDGKTDYTMVLSLGGLTRGVRVIDMAEAYGALANRGIKVEPVAILRVEDKDGNVLEEAQPRRTIVVSEQVAYVLTSMLRDVITKPGGTGQLANIGRPCAGKTGTTSSYTDAWFCGYTPDMVGIVWMGFDQDKTMAQWKVTGGSYPAMIWNRMMKEVLKDIPPSDFTMPPNIVSSKFCRKSGLLPGPFCPPSDIGGARTYTILHVPYCVGHAGQSAGGNRTNKSLNVIMRDSS
jgi:penicillin-binding protein 1A